MQRIGRIRIRVKINAATTYLVPAVTSLQGYLAHKKQPPPKTLQGPMVVVGVGGVSHERGAPVNAQSPGLYGKEYLVAMLVPNSDKQMSSLARPRIRTMIICDVFQFKRFLAMIFPPKGPCTRHTFLSLYRGRAILAGRHPPPGTR